jgi:hypothetical protein
MMLAIFSRIAAIPASVFLVMLLCRDVENAWREASGDSHGFGVGWVCGNRATVITATCRHSARCAHLEHANDSACGTASRCLGARACPGYATDGSRLDAVLSPAWHVGNGGIASASPYASGREQQAQHHQDSAQDRHQYAETGKRGKQAESLRPFEPRAPIKKRERRCLRARLSQEERLRSFLSQAQVETLMQHAAVDALAAGAAMDRRQRRGRHHDRRGSGAAL